MKQRLPMILSVAGLASIWTTAAAADVYDCTTAHFGSGGWVGSRYILAFERGEVAGSILGPVIQQVHKAPIPVDVKNPSPIRWEFRYTIVGAKPSNSGSARISYKIVLNTQANRFSLSGRLHGFDNQISGSGTCKRVE